MRIIATTAATTTKMTKKIQQLLYLCSKANAFPSAITPFEFRHAFFHDCILLRIAAHPLPVVDAIFEQFRRNEELCFVLNKNEN